jgi:hypothetical protein
MRIRRQAGSVKVRFLERWTDCSVEGFRPASIIEVDLDDLLPFEKVLG